MKARPYSPKSKKISHMIHGMDRNEPNAVTHIYACFPDEMSPFAPMCARGWNRSDGQGFSIFRGNVGNNGVCLVCRRREANGLMPIKRLKRKTKWL